MLALSLLLAAGVGAHAVTPTEKVITLLEDLKAEVETDGQEEATLYDTFACFCQSMTESKSEAIKVEQDNIDTFNSEIEAQSIVSKNKAIEIQENNQQIAEVIKTRATTEQRREKEKEKYETNSADLNKGIANLEAAVTDLQAGLGGAAALMTLKKSVRRTVVMADLLGLAHNEKQKKAIAQLLQENEDQAPPANEGSGDIITTMNDLLTDFKDQKSKIDSIEGQNKADFTASMTALKEQEDSANTAKDDAQRAKDDADEEVAKNSKDLEEENAKYADDSLYLADVTQKCELKAREFDQHSKTRSGELEALSSAIDIIKDRVKGNADESVKRAALLATKVKVTSGMEADITVEEKEMDQDDLAGIADLDKWSLLQTSNPTTPKTKLANLLSSKRTVSTQKQKLSAEALSKRTEKVAEALAEAGAKLKSPMLNAFALKLRTKLAFDPFVKVRKLVQDLIQRLVEEATAEATKKGFCDTEMGKSKHSRDVNMEEVQRLNAETEGLEAQKARLETEVSDLSGELAELDDALFKTTKLRSAEKAENEDTVAKSKAGLEAINDAKKVLEEFYSKAKKNDVSLLQAKASPVLEDMPEEPKGGAYKGGQEKAGGIMAMIEVIVSDFERTIKVTTQTEKDAQREFVEFERTTKSSIASKTNQKANAESSLKATTNQITNNMDLLSSRMKMLDDNLRELEELKPTCVDTGMSFQERTQKREEEIDALKNALCMLDNQDVEPDCPRR